MNPFALKEVTPFVSVTSAAVEFGEGVRLFVDPRTLSTYLNAVAAFRALTISNPGENYPAFVTVVEVPLPV